MSKNTAHVDVNIINKAQSTNPPPLGIAFVLGPTERGIPNDPSELITSVGQFEKAFGGILATTDFPLMCEQALQGGAALRVCKVVGAGATPGQASLFWGGAAIEQFLDLTSKGYGTYYNDGTKFNADTLPPSNGEAGSFNLMVTDVEAGITEVYENLKPTIGLANTQVWAKEIFDTSRLVIPTYIEITGLTGSIVPVGDIAFTGGLDSIPAEPDYQGIQANKTGFYAFDDFDDGNVVSTMDQVTETMYAIGQAYASLRKDMVYIQHLDNLKSTSVEIVAFLDPLAATKYAMMVLGGVKVADAINGGLKSMMGTGMVLGAIATSQNTYGPWYSPTAFIRGLLPGASGVVNNFGSPASQGERNTIANSGGNCIVNKSQTIMLWDAYTMALGNSPEKFFSVIQLEIYMVDVLKPLLEGFLGEPNHWNTWERIYYTCLPFLNSLVNDEAIYEFKYNGDQFATSLDDLQINDPTEVGQGIYRIQLQIKVVVPIVEITLNIILTENSVSFV